MDASVFAISSSLDFNFALFFWSLEKQSNIHTNSEIMDKKMGRLDQCFSTFWASSPGWRQIFTLLSRSQFFVKFLSLWCAFNLVYFYYKIDQDGKSFR